jgi:hypothetical protein
VSDLIQVRINRLQIRAVTVESWHMLLNTHVVLSAIPSYRCSSPTKQTESPRYSAGSVFQGHPTIGSLHH